MKGINLMLFMGATVEIATTEISTITHFKSNGNNFHVPGTCAKHFSCLTSSNLCNSTAKRSLILGRASWASMFSKKIFHLSLPEAKSGWASCPDHTAIKWQTLAFWGQNTHSCPWAALTCGQALAGIARLCGPDAVGRQRDVVPTVGDPNHIASSLVGDVGNSVCAIFIIMDNGSFGFSLLVLWITEKCYLGCCRQDVETIQRKPWQILLIN